MIYLDSRYADGNIFKALNPQNNQTAVTVFRTWPTLVANYFIYEWVETDRLDILAWKFFGSSAYWWKILDANPEIADCTSISPGTQLRIPSV